jgi:hypothetical protein
LLFASSNRAVVAETDGKLQGTARIRSSFDGEGLPDGLWRALCHTARAMARTSPRRVRSAHSSCPRGSSPSVAGCRLSGSTAKESRSSIFGGTVDEGRNGYFDGDYTESRFSCSLQ